VRVGESTCCPGLRNRITLMRIRPLFFLNATPDPTPYFNADPESDPAPHKSDKHLRLLIYRPSMTSFLAYSPPVCASFHGPPWLHFEPSKPLNYVRYDFNADSDPDTNPAFHSYADPASQDNVNPDLQP
jgi:hypothetical protein